MLSDDAAVGAERVAGGRGHRRERRHRTPVIRETIDVVVVVILVVFRVF